MFLIADAPWVRDPDFHSSYDEDDTFVYVSREEDEDEAL